MMYLHTSLVLDGRPFVLDPISRPIPLNFTAMWARLTLHPRGTLDAHHGLPFAPAVSTRRRGLRRRSAEEGHRETTTSPANPPSAEPPLGSSSTILPLSVNSPRPIGHLAHRPTLNHPRVSLSRGSAGSPSSLNLSHIPFSSWSCHRCSSLLRASASSPPPLCQKPRRWLVSAAVYLALLMH